MMVNVKNDVMILNDGVMILKMMDVMYLVVKMLVELLKL